MGIHEPAFCQAKCDGSGLIEYEYGKPLDAAARCRMTGWHDRQRGRSHVTEDQA